MSVSITYNGQVIATLEPGQKATLPCADKVMLSNVVIKGEAATYALSGTWVFNEKPDLRSLPLTYDHLYTKTIGFISNGVSFSGMEVYDRGVSCTLAYIGDNRVNAYDNNIVLLWSDENYRTITFDEPQTVSKDFYDWFTTNAAKQEEPTYELSGTWVVYSTVPMSLTETVHINFISNNALFDSMEFGAYGSPPNSGLYYCKDGHKVFAQNYLTGAWQNEAYRFMTFNEPQTVSKEFYEYYILFFKSYEDNASIEFTIEGTVYYAEAGMTWAEWVESEYNTGNFYIDDNFIINGQLGDDGEGDQTYKFIQYETMSESSSEIIMSNVNYQFSARGHIGGSND